VDRYGVRRQSTYRKRPQGSRLARLPQYRHAGSERIATNPAANGTNCHLSRYILPIRALSGTRCAFDSRKLDRPCPKLCEMGSMEFSNSDGFFVSVVLSTKFRVTMFPDEHGPAG